MALPSISSGTYVDQYDFSALGLSDGTAISSVSDPIGGNSATQATGANQPLCKTNILNGLSIGRFDGSNDFLDAAGVSVSQPNTIFVVAMSTIADAGGHNILDGTTSRQAVYETSGVVSMYAGSAEAQSGASWGTTNFHYVTSIFNGASSSCRVDGVAQTLTPGNPGTNALTGLRIGAFDAATSRWQGDIGEIVICSGALDSTDQAAVEGYIVAKWFTQTAPDTVNARDFGQHTIGPF